VGRPTNPPVITAAVVKGLAHPDFLVEIDAIAVVPGLTGDAGELRNPVTSPERPSGLAKRFSSS
jgi:hypothetical protein